MMTFVMIFLKSSDFLPSSIARSSTPLINQIIPNKGSLYGGQLLTILGQNLKSSQEQLKTSEKSRIKRCESLSIKIFGKNRISDSKTLIFQ